MSLEPVVVVGDGWAALAAVGFLACSGVEVHWIEGSGTKMTAPLSSMEWGPAFDLCSELGRQLEVDLGEVHQGSFIREHRNKSFRQPPWMKAPDPKTRLELRDKVLWVPETKIASILSAKFSIPLVEIEEKFRDILLNTRFRNLQRVGGVPLSGFHAESDHFRVSLANGQSIRCSQVIYADRWSLLRKIEGFPKSLKFIQKRDSMGALQAVFEHRSPVGLEVPENFYAPIHKENGEMIERNLWGYFSSDGMRSFWTLYLAEDEVENNHEIAKKFRRLKSTLDRIFTAEPFMPKIQESHNTLPKFTANIVAEQVRLIEDAIFSAGKILVEPISLDQLPGVVFMTDGYGPACAFQQVGAFLGVTCLQEEIINSPHEELEMQGVTALT
jgi:hypothetical protein